MMPYHKILVYNSRYKYYETYVVNTFSGI